MATCNGCGGVIGRDCFNPQECEWISSQQNAQEDYSRGYQQAQVDQYEKDLRQDYEDHLNPESLQNKYSDLLAENKKLRDALEKIMNHYDTGGEYFNPAFSIAKAALTK